MEKTAFENVKPQIGFCGIWCGSCPAGNGTITELTRKYAELVKNCNLEKWAPKNFDYKEFEKGLAAVQAMPSCAGCLKGGGPPTCQIRICALQKNMPNCSQCPKLSSCPNLDKLEKELPTLRAGLEKIKNTNQKTLIANWTSEIQNKWPHCVTLCPSRQK